MNNAKAAMIDMSPPYPCIKAEHDVDTTTTQQELSGSREAVRMLTDRHIMCMSLIFAIRWSHCIISYWNQHSKIVHLQ